MSLEERARRAAQEASSREAAEQRAERRKAIDDGQREARVAIEAWASDPRLAITELEISSLTFEDAVDPSFDDKGGPDHPPRFVARLAADGLSLQAIYNLRGPYSALGRQGHGAGLHVHLEGAQHYAFPNIEIHTAADLGRALAQVDAIRQHTKDDQPVDYFFGVAVPVRIEKWILAGIAAVIVIIVLVARA